MSIHLVLLVLTVSSRVTIGSDEVLRQSKSGDLQIQVTVDANSVITSTEMQGAILKSEKEATTRKIEVSTTPPRAETAKEPTSSHPTGKKRTESSTSTKETSSEYVDQGASDQEASLSASSSTGRRQGLTAQNRDSKLMSLLAARRSALQRNRFGSHLRVATTNRTIIESTSKSPSDPRSTCERNCTKNFTRRTTASCMRRCVIMHRAVNNTTTTPPSVRTKVDEKDNNEILFTDESSHGFFVVTKELNDTTNHISDGAKATSSSSAEKANKVRTKLRPSLSIEEVDMRPYVYFGQKLPPLKPTALKITKVSDDHPKILEVSVTKPTERSKTRNRYNPRERNIAAYNRRHGLGNFTRHIVSSSTSKPVFGAFKSSSEEKYLKEATLVDHSSLTLLARSPQVESAKLQLSTENSVKSLDVTESSRKQPHEFIPVTLILEDDSTPLIISVPEESTDGAPMEISQSVINGKNLAFLESTVDPPTESTSSTLGTTKVATLSTTISTPSIMVDITKPPKSSTTLSPSTITSTSTSENVQQVLSPSGLGILEEKLATSSSTSIPESYTRTTVSSSVRSTVNPISSTSTTTPLSSTIDNNSLLDIDNKTMVTNTSENTNFTAPIPLDFISISPGQNHSTKDVENEEIEGVVLANNEVTMEMNRINTATYVLAGLGMFPVAIIILYVGKTILLKRRPKDDDDLDNYITDQQPISPVRKMEHLEEEKSEQYSIISSYQEFDRKKMRFKSLLGEGNFGQVWKAEADDLSGHLGTTRIVAVKTMRAGSTQVGLKEEAEIMKKLGSHPNVVTLLGACVDTEPHLLIMEYAMRGRLLSLLRAARSATNILPASVPGGRSLAPLSPRTLAGFALDIARGMEYIAEKKIVHRDLAARNVLLDHNGVCKICDFGMSIDLEAERKTQTPTRKVDIMRTPSCLEHRLRLDIGVRLTNHWNHINNNNNSNISHEKKQHDSISKRPALPIRWMAPEALQYHIFTTETDVWAFGIVLWEIATLGCTPYPNLSGREVVRCVPNGARPELPKDGRPEFYELMSRCWHKEPRQRPTFKEARIEISRTIYKWVDDDTANSDYMDVSGFSEDLEHGMVYFNRRISEFECEI